MKNGTKVVGGLLVAGAIGAGIYYGFVKKGEDTLTWFARMTKPKEDVKKEVVTDATTDAVHGTKKKPVEKKVVPKADPAPTSGFKKGQFVYAKQDMALFTQPSAEARFQKAKAMEFDKLGTYDSTSSSYAGWSKIWVTKTLGNVANSWFAYVKTDMLTSQGT